MWSIMITAAITIITITTKGLTDCGMIKEKMFLEAYYENCSYL